MTSTMKSSLKLSSSGISSCNFISRMRDYQGGGIILSIYEIMAGLLERREYKRSGNIRVNTVHVFFYKKLGSAPSTKSFLISNENFAIIVLKVS